MWLAAFCALTARCRLPAKLLLTNFQTSSMATRCSSLSRRMASCTYAMFRRTALHAIFRHSAPHATSDRCMTMQLRGVHGLPFPADPGLGLRLDHEDEEDWGEWTRAGRRTHDDQRRPRSPSIPPARHRVPSDQDELIHLPVRHPAPSLGSHRFTLRSGSRIEEIAILIDEVLYYTLPCIATLVFPEPDKWKKSWETVYRSLMPHRRSIIEDEQRVKSVSELPPSPPPHGNPGPWTAQVIKEISREFKISPDSLPAQLIVQLGVCEECWPYILKTRRTYHRFQPAKKDTRKNYFGIIFSFEPRRLLPDKHRTQSNAIHCGS